MTREQLTAQGYVETAPGVWAKRKPDAVAPLAGAQPQPHPLPALEQSAKARPGRARRLVVVVTIISVRHRRIDQDNCVGGTKGLRDAIARSIGLDDADPRLRWEYEQILTTGETGTLVRISCL